MPMVAFIAPPPRGSMNGCILAAIFAASVGPVIVRTLVHDSATPGCPCRAR